MFGFGIRKSRDTDGDGPVTKQSNEENNPRQMSNGGDDVCHGKGAAGARESRGDSVRQIREDSAQSSPGSPDHVRLSKRMLIPRLSKEDSIRSSDDQHQYVVEPKTFQELGELLHGKNANDLIVIDFYAPWCGPCKKIAPVFLTLSKEYQERILFVKVNVDKIEDALAAMSVKAMPTFVAMKGNAEVDRIVGGDQMALEGLVAKLSEC